MGAPIIHGPRGGEQHGSGPLSIAIKATAEDTGGSFFLSEATLPPGFEGPPLHTHERTHDMFYVLEGTLTLLVDGESHALGAGSFACMPPGTVHTFVNRSPEPMRVLNLQTPGGWEHYMRELGQAARSGPLTPEVMGRIASQHDFRLV